MNSPTAAVLEGLKVFGPPQSPFSAYYHSVLAKYGKLPKRRKSSAVQAERTAKRKKHKADYQKLLALCEVC